MKGPGVDTTLKQRIIERAGLLGFDAVGVARADEPLGIEHDRYLAFIDSEKHGNMDYLAANREARRRLDSEAILPGAKSVICLARSYRRPAAEQAADPPLAKLCATYARGHDYHNHLRKKLRALARFVRTLGDAVVARPLCDEEPVLERAWAVRSGLGFVGKNGLVIVPGQGSFVLLGEVVTTLELPPDVPMAERCGSCTRCLDVCPTQAFSAPFVLDPRRCVAYLTIEDPLGDEPGRPEAGEHLFGCDDCQTACPYNRGEVNAGRTQSFEPLDVFRDKGLADMVALDDAAFRSFTTGSPLFRATRAGLAKNAVGSAKARLANGACSESERADAERAIDLGRSHEHPAVRRAAWEIE
jgi:epoxyqueuosine reductase